MWKDYYGVWPFWSRGGLIREGKAFLKEVYVAMEIDFGVHYEQAIPSVDKDSCYMKIKM